MSRSTYIYMVLDGAAPVAVFTVKHEMMTWIDRNPGDYELRRFSDGAHSEPTVMGR